jgi:sugar O-acyltransferase (sialic acid O-acetyltransferase NeuD family)
MLIIGAGSFSPEVDELARLIGYDNIAFLDDNPAGACSSPVIGTMADIKKMREKYDTAIVALGNNANRIKYHQALKENGYTIPTLIHPTAYISPDAEIAEGCIIRAKVVVSRYVKIGEATILNVGALIDHHVEIGYGCHILMGAVVRNMAKVEPLTRVESLSLVQ